MADEGTFLRRPRKGATRIWGLSACEDCGFEARGEISVTEEAGVMRRRCDGCAGARYPGIVEAHGWGERLVTWMPEVSHPVAIGLARTMAVLYALEEHASDRKGEVSPVLVRAANGAERINAFFQSRADMLAKAIGVEDARNVPGRLESMGADVDALVRSGLRIVPWFPARSSLDRWMESGTFLGLTAEVIEATGGYHEA